VAIDKRVDCAATAMDGVGDGATVLISGFGGAGFPNALVAALRERGPRDLTLVVNSATHKYSLTHELIEAGMVRRVVCALLATVDAAELRERTGAPVAIADDCAVLVAPELD